MKDVLFVCVHNSGRSQMARALFNRAAQERGLALTAGSAGTHPAREVNPVVLQVMREIGLDLSAERPQPLTDAMACDASRIFTMGCRVDARECPAILLRDVEDWGLPDPKGKPLHDVRDIRDEVAPLVETLIESLDG